ncbi:hypothetical protein PhCBS80983_g04936 [Powellomyces hirtus]|uniref:Uncharacterized protein n=1 Tax=Powellomyces hirtus TaxID=109895 RepID=A0A507DVZ9_9FUNG|nr:hypothetical protein PhCBS80983_g04936 [Powellomyces hirtus]
MRLLTVLSSLVGLVAVQNAAAAPQIRSFPSAPTIEIPALPSNYEKLSALEKQELIWNRIKATSNSSQDWNGAVETAWLLTTLPPRPPFDRVDDEMVKGRKKFIRNRGAHALVKVVPKDTFNGYTGIWATGSTNGVVRLTTLDEPPKNPKPEDIVIAPGGTLKLWRDGIPSTNLFFIYSLEGQKSWNYFQNPCSNHLAPPKELKTKVAKKLNQRVSHFSEMTGTSGLATFTTDGKPVAAPKYPFQVWLVPSAEVKANPPVLTPETAGANFASHFTAIPKGSPLYNVWAIPEPIQPYDPATVYHPETLVGATHIADIVTDSEFTQSFYGDAHLHFKHTSFDDDLKLRPDWEPIVKSGRD